MTKLTSTFGDAFRSLIKNDAVRVVTSRVLSSGTGEFADEYFAQMLSPAVENIAFDGEEFKQHVADVDCLKINNRVELKEKTGKSYTILIILCPKNILGLPN